MHGVSNNFSLATEAQLAALGGEWNCVICNGGKDDPSDYGAQRTVIIRHLPPSSSAEAPVYHYEHADCMLQAAARSGGVWRCAQRCGRQATTAAIRALAPPPLSSGIFGTFSEFKERTFSKEAFQNIACISAFFAAAAAVASPFFPVAFAAAFLTIASGTSVAWFLPKTVSWLVDVATAHIEMDPTARKIATAAARLFTWILITPHLAAFFGEHLLSPLVHRIVSTASDYPWASALSELPLPLQDLFMFSAKVATEVSFLHIIVTPEELQPIG